MSPALQSSVLLIAAAVTLVRGGEWHYEDQSHWGGVCQKGSNQSPIDLSPVDAKFAQLDKISFTNYEKPLKYNLVNNGHTAQLGLQDTKATSMSGGGLAGVYYLEQMHFHWGSEHTTQGRRSPLELHLVHYSKQYSGVSEASQHPKGLAVVGVLFKESAENNGKLDPLIAALKNVADDETPFEMSIAPNAMMPDDVKLFYRYEGSLTTPGCNETVVWTVMIATVPISNAQLKSFRELKAHDKLISNNYRNVQNLNGRTVTTTVATAGVVRLLPVTSMLLALALSVTAVAV